MTLAAIFGTVAAYAAALDELSIADCERMLSQGKFLGLSQRREYIDGLVERVHWRDQYRFHMVQGRLLSETAPTTNLKDLPDLLALQAQAEFASSQQLLPLQNDIDAPARAGSQVLSRNKLESMIARRIAQFLGDMGFDGHCPSRSPRSSTAPTPVAGIGPGQPDFFASVPQELSELGSRFVNDALAVWLFVIALACFAVSLTDADKPRQANDRRPQEQRLKYQVWLEYVGGGVLAYAIWFAFRVDPDKWGIFGAGVVVWLVAAVVVLVWAMRRRPPAEPAPETHHELELPEHDTHSFVGGCLHFRPAGGWRTFLIAFAAVLSAWTGYLYSGAINHAHEHAVSALEHEVAMITEASNGRVLSYFILNRLAALNEYRLHYLLASQQLLLPGEGQILPKDRAPFWAMEARRWETAIAGLGDRARQEFFGPDGPDQDAYFPEHLLVTKTVARPQREFAIWDWEKELSLGFRLQANTYLPALMVFAIALYFLGQSLALGRTTAALILGIFGCLFLLIGIGTDAIGLLTNPRDPSTLAPVPVVCRTSGESSTEASPAEVAALCFAKGMELEALAHDKEGYAKASDAYREAVKARPHFALAHHRLAMTIMAGESPPSSRWFFALVSSSKLKEVVRQEEAAVDEWSGRSLGAPPILRVLTGFGGRSINIPPRRRVLTAISRRALALYTADRQGLKQAIRDMGAALDRGEGWPYLHYKLAVALLADGQMEKASKEYDLAIEQTNQHADALDVGMKSGLAAGIITDLEVLDAFCPQLGWNSKQYCDDIASRGNALRSRVVQAFWERHGPGSSGAVLKVSPAGAGWVPTSPPKDAAPAPSGSAIVVWYRQDPALNVWYVLPDLSFQVVPSALERRASPDGPYYLPYLGWSGFRSCLQDGKYRAEVYRNGKMVRNLNDDVGDPNSGVHYNAAASYDLGLAGCYPSEWRRWTSASPDPGMVAGFTSEDKTRGALLFGYFRPQGPAVAPAREEREVIEQSIDFLRQEGLVDSSVPAKDWKHPKDGACGLDWDHWGGVSASSWANPLERPNVRQAKPGTEGRCMQYVSLEHDGAVVLAKARIGCGGFVQVGVVFRHLGFGELALSNPADDAISDHVFASLVATDSSLGTDEIPVRAGPGTDHGSPAFECPPR
jgi:hypothetical protein